MNLALGRAGVVLALVAAVFGVISIAVGLLEDRPAIRRTAKWYALLALGGALLATVAMERALITRDFTVEFRCAKVKVNHIGIRPELFREGIPVVLEGSFADGTDTYRSDQIFVKHTEEYSAEEKERLERADEEACPT